MKKYVAFDIEYHIPRIIYNYMKEKEYIQFVKVKDKKGNTNTTSRLAKEFNIEILPQLTEQELKELAQRQAMAAGDANAIS